MGVNFTGFTCIPINRMKQLHGWLASDASAEKLDVVQHFLQTAAIHTFALFYYFYVCKAIKIHIAC